MQASPILGDLNPSVHSAHVVSGVIHPATGKWVAMHVVHRVVHEVTVQKPFSFATRREFKRARLRAADIVRIR